MVRRRIEFRAHDPFVYSRMPECRGAVARGRERAHQAECVPATERLVRSQALPPANRKTGVAGPVGLSRKRFECAAKLIGEARLFPR
jgi:hypothetical protein